MCNLPTKLPTPYNKYRHLCYYGHLMVTNVAPYPYSRNEAS